VRTEPLYRERYILLTSAAGAFAKRRTLTRAEAATVPLCLLTPDMQNRRILDAIFRSVNRAPTPAIETNSVLTLCSHVRDGHWSSVVPTPSCTSSACPPACARSRWSSPSPPT
jgi:DNA-binding transcriptional LysR family regulator